jgi:hypothetical protein
MLNRLERKRPACPFQRSVEWLKPDNLKSLSEPINAAHGGCVISDELRVSRLVLAKPRSGRASAPRTLQSVRSGLFTAFIFQTS